MGSNVAERLSSAGTSALSDALDRLGIAGQALGILPMARGTAFAGPAFTIKMIPVGMAGGNVGDYIDDVSEGDVVVLDNDGRLDATVWGNILTTVAHHKKVAATVIDGVCRDSALCVELNYPVFARGNTMRTGKDRVTLDAVNVPVQLSGVRVEPGDWLAGDDDGVVCIPASALKQVLRIVEEIERKEALILDRWRGGARLDEARRAIGYHELQRREATPLSSPETGA